MGITPRGVSRNTGLKIDSIPALVFLTVGPRPTGKVLRFGRSEALFQLYRTLTVRRTERANHELFDTPSVLSALLLVLCAGAALSFTPLQERGNSTTGRPD